MLDCGRIADAIGEYKTCADNERPGGQHDSHNNMSHGLAHCMPKLELLTPRHAPPCRPSPTSACLPPDLGRPEIGSSNAPATARFQGSANTVSWPPSDV